MTVEATSADQDFLQKWRLVVQLVHLSHLTPEFQPSLTQLVISTERAIQEAGGLAIGALVERYGLALEHQRLLATILVDRKSRLAAAQLAQIAYLMPAKELDWEAASQALARLEELDLVRATDDEPRTQESHYTPGPELAELARVARGQGPAAAQTISPDTTGMDPLITQRIARQVGGPPPVPVPAPLPPPVLIGRWELELWAIAFRTRQAIHRWIRAHHDPYKAFAGNYASAVDAPKVEGLATEADRIEEELTAKGERENALERIRRVFRVTPLDARVLLYLFLAEVTDTGLPLEGRAIMAAVASDALLAERERDPAVDPGTMIDAALAPHCPLVKQGWVHLIANGNSPYTSTYQLNRTALTRLGVDPLARPIAAKVARGPNEGLGEVREARVSLDQVILPEETSAELLDALALVDGGARELVPEGLRKQLLYKGRGTVLLFEGPPGTGKTMAAEALAKHLGRRLLVARYERIEDFLLGNSQKNISKLFEEASKAKAVLVLDEADALLASRTPVHQAWDQHRNTLVNLMLGCLEEHDGVVVLTTNLAVNLDPALERRLTARVRFGLPALADRARLWRSYLPEDVPLEGTVDVERLAHQYPMSGARVRNAVLSALRKALRRRVQQPADTSPVMLTAVDVTESAGEEYRASYRDRGARDDGADGVAVGDLKPASVTLDQVVLTDAVRKTLRETLVALAPEARALFESPAFLETFRTGRGVVLLFEGPPGTGKTLTAEAIAGELGKQVYLVTPERLLSKWYGQTERALSRIFDEAAGHQAVLVVDEADSLLEARHEASEFGGRTANNTVNLFLRKLEELTGIAILITNRATHLDPALERRLSARITFEPPELPERVEILKRHIPAGVTLADDVVLEELARDYPLAGGRLRNAVLTAIRRTLAADPAARVLTRAALEEGLKTASASPGQRLIGFKP